MCTQEFIPVIIQELSDRPSEFLWVFPEVYFLMLEFQLKMSDVVMENLNII